MCRNACWVSKTAVKPAMMSTLEMMALTKRREARLEVKKLMFSLGVITILINKY